ncbi:MAG: hypothetical protein U9Q77_03025 [Candidatus Marinimicrobia bacterium]|nr:hypothetical protein [Candidatus Neomarinimicrobiota bacterium]
MRISLAILFIITFGFAQVTGPLPDFSADMDYFCYYGSMGEAEVYQAQYFDLIILSGLQVAAEEVQDIQNGLDNLSGTDDDVLVFAYLSMGESGSSNVTGDGSGPVYYNGADTIFQHAGYASFFLDDQDHNGAPDMNGTWNSYFVNAGDPSWWEYNATMVDAILIEKACDGLFLDTITVPAPASWGGVYGWTTQGMAEYIAHLRSQYPDKFLFANNPSIYMHPSLPGFAYRDLIRTSINAYMYEGYYLTWDWEQEIGYVSPWFENARDTWAPLINAEAIKPDGFTPVALDYVTVEQADYETLLTQQIQFTEVDQAWLTAVSSVMLNEIRYDAYHNHPVDNNPPTWTNLPGVLYFEYDAAEVTLYWNAAIDQTWPISYQLYFGDAFPDFDEGNIFEIISPTASENFDWEFTVNNVEVFSEYFVAMRAIDGTPEAHTDMNRRVYQISTDPNSFGDLAIDGQFNDWLNIDNLDVQGALIEMAGDTPISACDIVDVWAAHDEDFLYFSCSFSEIPQINSYFYHLFLDTDENFSTGFHSGGSALGADYMVENSSLWHYTGSNDSWSWEWIGGIDLHVGITGEPRFEASIPIETLNLAGIQLNLLFNVNDNSEVGDDDYAPDEYTTDSYSYDMTPLGVQNLSLPESMIISTSPNPFNTAVTFTITKPAGYGGKGHIDIYDLRGRLVNSIKFQVGVDEQITWNGRDNRNRNIASGLYLFRVLKDNNAKDPLLSVGKVLALK